MQTESRRWVPEVGWRMGSWCLWVFFFFFCLFRATHAAYGGSQARHLIRAVAAGLRQSHSNTGSEPHLQPTPELRAMPDP